jgi:hypothetical protein
LFGSKTNQRPKTVRQIFLQAHQFSLLTRFPLVLPEAGTLRPLETTVPKKSLSFTSLLTMLYKIWYTYRQHTNKLCASFTFK